MPHTLAVEPLDRTCTEVLANDGQSREQASPTTEPITMYVRQLADVSVFVLLGEPGMGKSETMRALTALVQGEYITVNDFIVGSAKDQNDPHPVLIDALDEARASGDKTVWRELRKSIAQAQLTRFGVACRAADWYTSDREDLASVAQGKTVRVFSLNPLSPEQRHVVLTREGISEQEVDTFEQQAQSLGFADMLVNPQLLKLLAAAVKSNQNQWPQTRSEAFELACNELVKEEKKRHFQGQRETTLLSHEVLLDAAGWLCALMLLSNRNEVSDETPNHRTGSTMWLVDVLDILPATVFPTEAIQQVLKRPLFLKPKDYVYAHRTVAEYLAARHITKRIADGLLPSRVASLMLASPEHLVSNLRGLAGWLAALSEPMRASIFEADPAAVLTYGDLHLLPTSAKQSLISQLVRHPRAHAEGNLWRQAASQHPLVQGDMRSFVMEWLTHFRELTSPSSQQTMVTHLLLNALACAPAEPLWEPSLLGLLKDERMIKDIRNSALDALCVHKSSPTTLLTLLDDVYRDDLRDLRGGLADHLLQYLYPQNLGPSQVLRFLKPTHYRPGGGSASTTFWSYHIEKATPAELLPEFMAAMERVMSDGLFKDDAFDEASHELDGLASLVLRAIETLGTSIPIAQLSRWLWMCLDWQTSPFKSIAHQGAPRLDAWLSAHTDLIKPVLTHWVQEGVSSWDAQNRLRGSIFIPGMGAFWLDQAKAYLVTHEVAKAKACLETAVWWINQPDSGITLDDVMTIAELSIELKESLEPLLVSSLGDDNWQRQGWLQTQKYREKAAAKKELDEKNLCYLLEHLTNVRDGKLLNYLSEAAWEDLKDSGYGGGLNGELLTQWRNEHRELAEATRQGYRTLLHQLTLEQATSAINSRKNNSIWHFELPCLVAAQEIYAQDPQKLLQLEKEQIQALITLYFLHNISKSEWMLALVESYPDWVEEVWWQLCAKNMRSKTAIRIPHFHLLAREPRVRPIALRLLPRLLVVWPTKFSEANFPEFAQLLETTLKICPSVVVSELVAQRLQKKSLSSLQRAYLVMAGLWTDPPAFATMMDALLLKKQIAQSELLGFIGYLRRYGDSSEALPRWKAATMGQLFRLFGPLCPSARPTGANFRGAKDDGRDFLYQLLTILRNNISDSAESVLLQLVSDPTLRDWKEQLEDCLSRQRQAKAEQAFALPTVRQVALTLQNSTPANPADLMAVALATLGEIQKTLHNSSTNRIHRFWAVDSAGKRPLPPHRPEPECRNAIADWLTAPMSAMGISVIPEHQHGEQNQSDIVLCVQPVGGQGMLLPIEVKGDWNRELWTASYEQLAKKYASDPRSHGKGIYLVLWLGTNRGKAARKQHPNQPASTAAELQEQLQRETNSKALGMDIRVFVLDISIRKK